MKLGQQIGLYLYPSTEPEVIDLWEKLGKGTVAKTIFLALIEKQLAVGRLSNGNLIKGFAPRTENDETFVKVRLSPNDSKHRMTIDTWNGLPKKLKSRTFICLLKECVGDVLNSEGEIEVSALLTTSAVIPDTQGGETAPNNEKPRLHLSELDNGIDENQSGQGGMMGSLLGSIEMD